MTKKTTKHVKVKKNTSNTTKRGISPTAGGVDWRAEMLERVRSVIMGVDRDIVEEVKWRKPSNSMKGVPVWSHPGCGIICTGEMHKSAVKLTFAKGAALGDPAGLFNASLEGNTRRAIDIHEGEKIDARALKALVREAIARGVSGRGAKQSTGVSRTRRKTKSG